MKIKLFVCAFLILGQVQAQSKFICRNGEISFFSKNSIEDIDAKTKEAVSVLDTATGRVSCKMLIKLFMFKDKLMQDHFNENYMESDKFPYAILDVNIMEPVTYYKDGTYQVNLNGTMQIHGVKRVFKTPATIEIVKGVITGKAEFIVKLKDYDIAIPKIVIKNIAEEIKVTVSLNYAHLEMKK